MDEAGQHLVVDPRWISINEIRVSADIHLDRTNQLWNVTVILSRSLETGAIQGNDIDAQFLDESGNAMRQEERPSGPLPELAEELRIEVDALFRFRSTSLVPVYLIVTYRDERIKFHVVHN